MCSPAPRGGRGQGHVPRAAPCLGSLQSPYGVYYKCPCESGLTCDADKTIVGSITNSYFGICKDRQSFKGLW